MRQILLRFSLLVVAIFLFGCAPQSAEDKSNVEELTLAEKAELPPDLKEEGIALAGKAVDFSGCIDADSLSTYDKNSLLTKSTTTYAGGSKEDKCYTWNKGTPQEKTRLIEGTCKNGKFLYWYATCSDYLGKDYGCEEGKCVQEVSDFVLEEVPLDWDITKPIFSKKIKGVFAKAVDSQGKEFTLNNLKLELFMDSNLQYYALGEWETSQQSVLSSLSIFGDHFIKPTGKKVTLQIEYVTITDAPFKIQGKTSSYLSENKEYIIKVQSYYEEYFPEQKTNNIGYNLTVKTPPIAKTKVECKKTVDHGAPENKLDFVFIPVEYSVEEIKAGKLEEDVHAILFEKVPESSNIEERVGFFEIPIFNQSFNLFNIVVVNEKVPCGSNNQLLSAAKNCGFNPDKDTIVVMHNVESGMASAEGIGLGNKIVMSKEWLGTGTVLAHEWSHLIGLDEEYYTLPAKTSKPINSWNCDYGNLTCSKWCQSVDLEKVKQIHTAKEKYDACTKLLADKNEVAWKEFCPTLDLKGKIEEVLAAGASYAGAKSQEEFCTFPLQKVVGYTCYAGTFWSLDRNESFNLGIGCQEGYQCYYGCGGNYEWTRSTFIGIMSGGAKGEGQYLWKQKEKNAGEKILPDFSPVANSAIKEYLENNFK